MNNTLQIQQTEPFLSQKPDSYLKRSLRALFRNPSAILGLIIVILIVLISLFADHIAPYDPTTQKLTNRLKPPTADHIMGTDMFGRDIFSRVVYGGQTSLRIGVLATVLGASIGAIFGIISGYIGGNVDLIIMRIVDAMLSFPTILLALIVIATIGTGERNVIIAIGFASLPGFARLIRADTMKVRNKEYISAAIVSGCKFPRLFFQHLLPNVSPIIIALASIEISKAILWEASLSFLGVGTQPPTPSWGLMVSSHRGLLQIASWTVLYPSFVITLTVLGLNLLGDGLRDALDPKLS